MGVTVGLYDDGHVPPEIGDFVGIEQGARGFAMRRAAAGAASLLVGRRGIRATFGLHGLFAQGVAQVFCAVEVVEVAEPLVGAVGKDRARGLAIVVLQL